MDNIENVLDELNDFDKHKTAEIPKVLEDYINHLAKTGDTVFPWQKIRGVIRHKLELVINNFKEICPTENLPPCPNVEPFNYETMRGKIFEQFDSFTCAPFTIQRLCELLCAPRKHYKRTDKFMRGVEKNLLVVSTVDPGLRKRTESVSSQTLVNGVIESNAATNRPAIVTSTEHRPSSVASDAVSISDADSGISDTEDEEKSSEKVSESAVPVTSEKPAEIGESSTSSHQVSNTEPVQETTEPSSTVTDFKGVEQPLQDTVTEKVSEPETLHELQRADSADAKLEDNSVSLAKSAAEEPSKSETEEQSVPAPQQTEQLTAPSETAKPALVMETPISDKKRPLEDDEDDQEPGAKQPRMYSPDKVVEESQSSEMISHETEAPSNEESSAGEQETAEHNTPGGEQAAPAGSDCQ